ncbi:MAG: hypothetical protein WEE53_14390 [Acidimicrobiia bacterium]
MKRLIDWLVGSQNWGAAGLSRSLRGLRKGDQRDLYLGLGLAALSFLRRTAPRKKLLYSRTVPEGSAIVIHNRRHGAPKIKVIKPKSRNP